MANHSPQQYQQQMPPQQQMPRVRILRVGIILGGNIIEERLVRRRETVTIGQSSKNTFSVPIEGLPKSWPLFLIENGRYIMQFTGAMDGRVSVGNQISTLTQLRSQAQNRGNYSAVPLDERSRGKISIGELTLLFQFVTAPPLAPRPRLPASVRGSVADRIDPHLAVIMAISILAHFALALYARSYDRVITTRADRLQRQFEEDKFQDRVIAENFDMAEIATDGEVEETGGEEQAEEDPGPSKPSNEPKGDGGDGGDNTPDDAGVREQVLNTGLALALATGGEDEGGRYGKMNETDQGAGLESSLEHAKGAKITAGGTAGSGRQRGTQSGKIGTDKGTKVGGPSSGGGAGTKKEEKISRVALGGVDDLSITSLDPDQVARLIKSRYLPGVKRCHQQLLKTDPTAGGRVTLRFTVAPTGKVTKATAKGFASSVDSCIKGQMMRWRFAAPKDDGKPVSADFQIPLLLKPGN